MFRYKDFLKNIFCKKSSFVVVFIMIILLNILSFFLGVLLSACDGNVEIFIESELQRKYYIDCLRLNNINFALKDDGVILIVGAEAYENLDFIDKDDKFYHAYKSNNLEICSPTK